MFANAVCIHDVALCQLWVRSEDLFLTVPFGASVTGTTLGGNSWKSAGIVLGWGDGLCVEDLGRRLQ